MQHYWTITSIDTSWWDISNDANTCNARRREQPCAMTKSSARMLIIACGMFIFTTDWLSTYDSKEDRDTTRNIHTTRTCMRFASILNCMEPVFGGAQNKSLCSQFTIVSDSLSHSLLYVLVFCLRVDAHIHPSIHPNSQSNHAKRVSHATMIVINIYNNICN